MPNPADVCGVCGINYGFDNGDPYSSHDPAQWTDVVEFHGVYPPEKFASHVFVPDMEGVTYDL